MTPHQLIRLLSIVILPLTLSQCVLSNTDPGFAALERTAELSPSPRAIHGMWHRRDTRLTMGDSTTSLLFRADGTVLSKGQMVMLGQAKDAPMEVKRYKYVGGGVWRITGTNATMKVSQGKLLFYYPIPQYYDEIRFVFERKA
jgi:hypothetical protein